MDASTFWVRCYDPTACLDFCMVAVAPDDVAMLDGHIAPLPLPSEAQARSTGGELITLWQYPKLGLVPLGGEHKMYASGEVAYADDNVLTYQVDTSTFSSGAPVVRNTDEVLLGVHTGPIGEHGCLHGEHNSANQACSIVEIVRRAKEVLRESQEGVPERT